jgi:hypothetical protein
MLEFVMTLKPVPASVIDEIVDTIFLPLVTTQIATRHSQLAHETDGGGAMTVASETRLVGPVAEITGGR